MTVFQITEPTEAKLTSVTPRTELHGDDEVPAVSISVEIECANTLLDLIDPSIRHALYKPKPEETPELPGVEVSTPVLRCNSIDRVKLTTAHEGWTLQLHHSIDDATPPWAFGGTKVDNMTVEAKQGGTVVLRLRCGTSDVDEARMGWLCVHKGQEITLALLAPKPGEERPAGDGAGDGERDATDLFAAGAGPDPADDTDTEGGETDAGAAQPERGENWPFPKGGSELSDMERSARDRAGEQPPQDATHEPLPKRGRGKGDGAAATH